ncbi:chromosomal replication initiator protein DnaA, partial [candidate division KSB3 bacterium]|nr:chromosomal replication initiator protein DnaA [candidate division KSB3 bacterium]MBD3323097.1 chromosomal replication initiator protein DnaA [candidate division KSB3 bacterium]
MQYTMWQQVLAKLEKRINRPSFNTWIRPTTLVSLQHKTLRIGVPNEIFVYWLGEHYLQVMTDALSEVMGFQPDISFVVTDRSGTDQGQEKPSPEAERSASPQNGNARKPVSPSPSKASPARPRERKQREESPRPAGSAKSTHRKNVLRLPSSQRKSQHFRFRGKDMLASLTSQKPAAEASPETEIPRSEGRVHPVISGTLNPGYTFDSYVVGNNNRFAHAAALAVADQMAVNYNPLFIYGGVGLGKTHLLHAIGNHLTQLSPQMRVLYLSAEQFINELVFSIREDRMAAFRKKYRNIDLLLVDDIQFIARKERTQEEFFHTFNTLYQAHKQIVLTSDCPPKKIPTIAEQLRSRFEWGLIADIQPPDLETRVAILKKKAEMQQLDLPDEIAIYIASQVKSNIRQLEGSLSKIKAYSTLICQEITLPLTRKALHDMFDTTPKKVTVELVQQVVANHYQVEPAAMRSSARNRRISFPRQIAMYLSRELTNLSLPDIGRNFGGRDHTTVLHACKKVERNQANDRSLKENLIQL